MTADRRGRCVALRHRHPQGEFGFHGEYPEITPPSWLVFTEIFEEFPDSVSVVTSEFAEEDGKTRLIVTVRYPLPEVRDTVLASGMSNGAAISYDRLEDVGCGAATILSVQSDRMRDVARYEEHGRAG